MAIFTIVQEILFNGAWIKIDTVLILNFIRKSKIPDHSILKYNLIFALFYPNFLSNRMLNVCFPFTKARMRNSHAPLKQILI
jgi:hypothetical protein